MNQRPADPNAPALSIVVPVYNEEESLEELLASIERAVAGFPGGYEVVFVDDGSTDGSLERLKKLSRIHPHLRVFSFRRNLGKSRALLCGFQMASGQYILTMDADLQDDPGNLARMYDQLRAEHADIVSGWRKDRRDHTLKVAFSRLFNRVTVRLLFGLTFKDMNSGLKLYRADAARALHLYGGMHRFIPVIATEMGYRVVECPVSHNQRKYGSSKYRLTKVLTEMPDLLTMFFLVKYTTKPLHFFAVAGSAMLAVGFLCLAYLAILWTQSIPIGTRPLLLFGVLLVLMGGQTVFTGLLADLIVGTHQGQGQDFPLKYTFDGEDSTVGGRRGRS